MLPGYTSEIVAGYMSYCPSKQMFTLMSAFQYRNFLIFKSKDRIRKYKGNQNYNPPTSQLQIQLLPNILSPFFANFQM